MEISEETYSSEDLVTGGNFSKRFSPADFIREGIKQKVFTVKSYLGVKKVPLKAGGTAERADFIIHDDFDEFKFSSWDYVCKDKISARNLVGKRVKLVAKDDKKVILEVLD